MFLLKVKVKNFVRSVTGSSEFYGNGARKHGRRMIKIANPKPNDVFTIIGQTQLYEGVTYSGGGDEPNTFEPRARHKVFIVAKGVGRRYKVLLDDLSFMEPED